MTGGRATASSRGLAEQAIATSIPTQSPARSNIRFPRSQAAWRQLASGSAARAATAASSAFTMANTAAHNAAAASNAGRSNQWARPSPTSSRNRNEADAPASPRVPARNAMDTTGAGARNRRTTITSAGAHNAQAGGISSATG